MKVNQPTGRTGAQRPSSLPPFRARSFTFTRLALAQWIVSSKPVGRLRLIACAARHEWSTGDGIPVLTQPFPLKLCSQASHLAWWDYIRLMCAYRPTAVMSLLSSRMGFEISEWRLSGSGNNEPMTVLRGARIDA